MRSIVQEKHWLIAAQDLRLQKELASQLGISPTIAQVIINRGITTPQEAKDFLSKDLNSLHDPFLMEDMDKVTSRLIRAINNGERIIIYGDYDADGLCATALLWIILREMGSRQCHYYLPNRLEEGYGLNKDAIHKCWKDGAQLLITVDCGISSPEEVDYANSLGMEVIITDHHIPSSPLPHCVGILNPKLTESKYPYKELAGVGVVYKLIEALAKKSRPMNIHQHLDLVALGTIADIVPITGENRTLVYHGLKAIKDTTKIGIQKLKERLKLEDDIQTGHVAFRLAPRINATGRLSTAEASLKLLLTNDPQEAEELARILDANNYERQRLEQEVLESAVEQVEMKFNFNTDKVIVIENRNWPVGVIGIVASRLVSRYHRPAIVITVENGLGRGSGRSIKKFHLLEALKSCKDHFIKFGGHALAGGFSIEEILIPSFRKKINEYAETVLAQQDLIPGLQIDAELGFQDITFEFIDELEELAPFGYDNPKPLFLSRNLQLYREPQIVGRNHLKLWLKSQGRVLEAIGFGMADWYSQFDEFNTVDLVYHPDINTWQGRETLQLQIQDMRLN